jgi:hypothetical protein
MPLHALVFQSFMLFFVGRAFHSHRLAYSCVTDPVVQSSGSANAVFTVGQASFSLSSTSVILAGVVPLIICAGCLILAGGCSFSSFVNSKLMIHPSSIYGSEPDLPPRFQNTVHQSSPAVIDSRACFGSHDHRVWPLDLVIDAVKRS